MGATETNSDTKPTAYLDVYKLQYAEGAQHLTNFQIEKSE